MRAWSEEKELWGEAFSVLGRFLTLRADFELFGRFSLRHLAIGALFTWLVGIARNWDLASATPTQAWGLQSLAYIIFMALGIWVLLLPLKAGRGYLHVLTMVSLTSVPGLIYGVPVEMFLPMEDARNTNVAFLVVVATWRVAMAVHYLKRACDLSGGGAMSVLGLPVSMIVIGLIQSGRAGAVLEMMGGLRTVGAEADAYVDQVIFTLGLIAYPFAFFCFIGYLMLLTGGGDGPPIQWRGRRPRIPDVDERLSPPVDLDKGPE